MASAKVSLCFCLFDSCFFPQGKFLIVCFVACFVFICLLFFVFFFFVVSAERRDGYLKFRCFRKELFADS